MEKMHWFHWNFHSKNRQKSNFRVFSETLCWDSELFSLDAIPRNCLTNTWWTRSREEWRRKLVKTLKKSQLLTLFYREGTILLTTNSRKNLLEKFSKKNPQKSRLQQVFTIDKPIGIGSNLTVTLLFWEKEKLPYIPGKVSRRVRDAHGHAKYYQFNPLGMSQ